MVPAGDPSPGLKAGAGEVDHHPAQHVPILRGKHQRKIGPNYNNTITVEIFFTKQTLTEISDANPWQNLLVYSKYMTPWEPISPACASQVSDICLLRIWFVFVSLRPISGVKPHKSRNPSLPLRSIPPGLCVCSPPHPLVDKYCVCSHLVSHYHSLESVGLEKRDFF